VNFLMSVLDEIVEKFAANLRAGKHKSLSDES
jgi:hypothetical protein